MEEKIRWQPIKEYLEENDCVIGGACELDEDDWVEVRGKIKQLDATERSKMNKDNGKIYLNPKYFNAMVRKQKGDKR
jgi:hypothetical protein